MEQKHFTCALEIKSVGEEGRFAGYASVFGVVDSQRDVIERGAFTRTLRERKGGVKLLWQHQMDEPIGNIERIFEDARGLYVEGRLLLGVARGKEAYDLLRSGAVEGLSIGYVPVKFDFDPVTGVRRIQEVTLFEVSLVTFPANEQAGVTVVKSAGRTQLIELSEALDRAIETLRA